jgi:ribosomal-protein-alanine N-acetyltransferase
MTIVSGESVDQLRVQKLFSQVVHETSQLNPAFMNWTELSIAQALSQYQFRLIQSDDNRVVSFICFQSAVDCVEILALGTLNEFQRQGYLKALLDSLASECSATSKSLTLEVHAQNLSAVALYQKCGFKTVRTRKNYYSDSGDAFVMDLSLI